MISNLDSTCLGTITRAILHGYFYWIPAPFHITSYVPLFQASQMKRLGLEDTLHMSNVFGNQFYFL